MKNHSYNLGYALVLKLVSKVVNCDNFLVLGSVATLSYTQKVDYQRQIHDLDIIMDIGLVSKVNKKLIKEGYKLDTFINKRMPFYKKLIEQAEKRYFRYVKNDIAVEVLSSPFIYSDEFLKIELYPNIWVKVPRESISKQNFGGVIFNTLDVNLLWAVKQFLNNTLGRFMKYKKEQREADLLALRKLVNKETARMLFSGCRVEFGKLEFKIPGFILN